MFYPCESVAADVFVAKAKRVAWNGNQRYEDTTQISKK